MDVAVKNKGIISVDEKSILEFPFGIVGFEEYKKYALIEAEYKPFIWLQSLDNENLAFLLVDPFFICSDYEADIDDGMLDKIGITKPEDIILMAIVTVPENGDITANLLGPLVINKKNNKCIQAVLTDNRWTTKYNIIEAVKHKGK